MYVCMYVCAVCYICRCICTLRIKFVADEKWERISIIKTNIVYLIVCMGVHYIMSYL